MCFFAGTGNVLKVQTLLLHCDEHTDKTKDEKDKEEEKEEKTKKKDVTFADQRVEAAAPAVERNDESGEEEDADADDDSDGEELGDGQDGFEEKQPRGHRHEDREAKKVGIEY